jgi:DnaJ family protein C protein 7
MISIDPANSSALQLQRDFNELENHFLNFESAKSIKNWEAASLALQQCSQAISKHGPVPIGWWIWKVELDIARGDWRAARITTQ